MMCIFHANSFFATFSTMPVESFHDYCQHFCHRTGLYDFLALPVHSGSF
jgi:hypothetical protein